MHILRMEEFKEEMPDLLQIVNAFSSKTRYNRIRNRGEKKKKANTFQEKKSDEGNITKMIL